MIYKSKQTNKQTNQPPWPNNSPKQKNPTNQKQNKKKWYRFFPNQGLGDLKTKNMLTLLISVFA